MNNMSSLPFSQNASSNFSRLFLRSSSPSLLAHLTDSTSFKVLPIGSRDWFLQSSLWDMRALCPHLFLNCSGTSNKILYLTHYHCNIIGETLVQSSECRKNRKTARDHTDLPEPQNILEAEFSLKPDQQPAEAEVQVTRVLRFWKTDTDTKNLKHTKLNTEKMQVLKWAVNLYFVVLQ